MNATLTFPSAGYTRPRESQKPMAAVDPNVVGAGAVGAVVVGAIGYFGGIFKNRSDRAVAKGDQTIRIADGLRDDQIAYIDRLLKRGEAQDAQIDNLISRNETLLRDSLTIQGKLDRAELQATTLSERQDRSEREIDRLKAVDADNARLTTELTFQTSRADGLQVKLDTVCADLDRLSIAANAQDRAVETQMTAARERQRMFELLKTAANGRESLLITEIAPLFQTIGMEE